MSISHINSILVQADTAVMEELLLSLKASIEEGNTSRMFQLHSQMQTVQRCLAERVHVEEPTPDWHQEARDCANVVEAIKLVRHNTGWGLRESKDWVDEHCGRLKAEQRYVRVQSLEDEVDRLERENRHLRDQLLMGG